MLIELGEDLLEDFVRKTKDTWQIPALLDGKGRHKGLKKRKWTAEQGAMVGSLREEDAAAIDALGIMRLSCHGVFDCRFW